MIKYLTIFATTIVLLAIIFFVFTRTQLFSKTELLSPLGTLLHSLELASSPSPKIVYGFLPFWQLKTASLQPELTHLAYFSLTIDETGQIITTNNNQADPGYRNFQSDAFQDVFTSTSTQKAIVISAFNSSDIETFLTTPSSQLQFQTTIDMLLQSNSLTHLNLDIEYSGTQSAQLQPHYTTFCHNIHSFLNQKYPDVQLSIDVYPSAIKGTNIWNIADLQSCVDHFIVMGYDFYRANSSTAGPVAPLLAEGLQKEEKNIVMYISEYLKVVPPHQIILGVPFYGYEWQTVSDQPRAQTFPQTGATASYERIQTILNNPEEYTAQKFWEESTLSPYLTYKQNGMQKIIFYEDERSLQYKLDLVKQTNLAGIAIWALGYEGEHRNLWDTIRDEFSKN